MKNTMIANMESRPCLICGELTSDIVLGWWGECPSCLFLIDQLGMTIEEVKEAREKAIAKQKGEQS